MQTSNLSSVRACLLFLVVLGCNQKTATLDSQADGPAKTPTLEPVDAEQLAHQAATAAEFTSIAERIEASENPYLGTAQIQRLEQSKVEPAVDLTKAVNNEMQLTWNHLRLGNLEQAKQSIDRAFEMVTSLGRTPQASMHRMRALVFLREAEYRNCVQRHNCDCCVFPLAGGGIHSIKEPMLSARDELIRFLRMQPRNLEAAWLLNLTAMAVGDHPAGVPHAYRIPESTFASDPDAPPLPRFRDVAQTANVDFLNLCGGAIVDDFNGDNLLDIVTSSYDPRGPLHVCLRKPGDLQFEVQTLEHQLGGLNCIASDYDGDGDTDVLVLRGAWLDDDGQIRNSLLQNDGHGRFRDVTKESGIGHSARPTQAAAWADFDQDGDLDLYIGNESRAEFPTDPKDYPAELLRNNGDGTFTDVAREWGVTNDRFCKGVATGDYDNDGDIDIYVSNRGKNRLYRNDGERFVDVAEELGVTEPSVQSFASWFFDYDNDGWLDLFVTAYQATNTDVALDYVGEPNKGAIPRLYRNLGGTFEDVTKQANLDRVTLPMGASFGDIDNDGLLDIYLATGRPDFATLTPNVMLRNHQGRTFQDVTTVTGLGHLQKGHGVAFADIDDDGDLDIYHQLGGFYPGDKFPNALFLNPGNPRNPEGENQFINITLRGRSPNTRAIGARVRVVMLDASGVERTLHRAVGAVSSFGGSPARLAIGLGKAKSIVRVEVDWPRISGETLPTQVWNDLEVNSFVELRQP